MNTAIVPTQGGNPAWQVIQAMDLLDDLNSDQTFIIALYRIAQSDSDLIDDDLYRLVETYLDQDPRGKITEVKGYLECARQLIKESPPLLCG
jgi:hypothetical protein